MEGARVWFGMGDVKRHIAEHHPACPTQIKKQIVFRVCSRHWREATVGLAVGLAMENYVRHEMTDYDTLLAAGQDRDDARKAVRQTVDAIIREWGSQSES